MPNLEHSAKQAIAELEDYLYKPGGAFEQLRGFLDDEGSEVIDGLTYALRTAARGVIRLSGRPESGIVVDLGKSEEAISSDNWESRALLPKEGPLTSSHQLHVNRAGKPLVLCPVRPWMAAGEQLIAPASPIDRLEFSQAYQQFIHEAIRRLED